jgi:hypothetical protein
MVNRANLQPQRFQIIDTLLKWEGEISNARLRQLMDIQTVQASRLIAEYRSAHPDRLLSDVAKKRYFRLPCRYEFGGTFDDYLGILKREDHLPAWVHRLDDQVSSINPDWIAAISKAVEAKSAIGINYLSMTQPSGTYRAIYPTALVQAGRRWHVRAWCCTRRDWRDFVLGRITRIDKTETLDRPQGVDEAWETSIKLLVQPHHLLTPAQAKVVKVEMLEGKAQRKIKTRAALAGYLIQELRASITTEQKPPQYQIEITNIGELNDVLGFAKQGGD